MKAREERRKSNVGGSLGTGYVTVIVIFTVICLAILAALSFKTVMNNSATGETGRSYTDAYYSAEESANRRLAELDGAAAEGRRTGNTALLTDYMQSSAGIAAVPDSEGWTAEWTEPVTDKISLHCSVLFYSDPELHAGRRYEIRQWKTDVDAGTDEVRLTVWDGSLF